MTNSIEAALSRLPKTKVEPNRQHNFKTGNYLLRISSTSKVTNYYVEEIISRSAFKARQVLSDGKLCSTTETISGDLISDFQPNLVANILAERK